MAGYIFLPVPTAEMLGFAHDWRTGQEGKGKRPYMILSNRYLNGIGKGASRLLSGGCLRLVTPQDKLYVLAHGPGTHGGGAIGAERGGIMKRYAAAELARLLEAEGLTKSIQDLRVYACGSGMIFQGDGNAYVQRLKGDMVRLGYRFIRVTGYLGNIRSSYAPRSLPSDPLKVTEGFHKGIYSEEDTAAFPAHTRRVVY